ncbi:MAG: LamG domain-containing protein [Pirellula sp.]
MPLKLLILFLSLFGQSQTDNSSLQLRIKTLAAAMDSVRKAYRDDFQKLSTSDAVENWYANLPHWPEPAESSLVAYFPMGESASTESVRGGTLKSLANRVDADLPGKGERETIATKQDGSHSAVILEGNNALLFPGVGAFHWTDEFTIAFEIKLPKSFQHAVVLCRTTSGQPSVRGYELVIDEGSFCLALNGGGPSNAIRIRCRDRLPADRWIQVALVYSGSKSADETFVYVDGKRCDSTIERDSLQQDFFIDASTPMAIGGQAIGQSPVGALVDRLQVYNSALTPIEIASIATDAAFLTWGELTDPQKVQWREHYARRADPQCRYHIESFQHYFKSMSNLLQNARE